MTRFRVWAPRARRVELDLAGERHPMTPATGDEWLADIPSAVAGTEYSYRLDGGAPLPDPRSPWQPHGVHGVSCVVQHEEFVWTDQGFNQRPLGSAIVYELHVGTFTPEGTFDAAIARLDRLCELGVTHVELMPVAEFPGDRGWGYDGVDLYAPHHAYGGPIGLKRLVDACHQRGLAVILDVVYNHLGPAGNYLECFGPYFSDKYATPWGKAVNFDEAGSVAVRRYFADNVLMWLRDYHIDGLRLDAVHAIFDQSAVPFLEQLACEVSELEAHLGRRLLLIAESDLNDPRLLHGRDAGGFGIDAQWSDDFHHALHALLAGERSGYYADFGLMQHLDQALRQAYVYTGQYSSHRQRNHGRAANGLSGSRFLGYLQNHDQVGNRALGERSSQLMSAGRLRIGAALVLLSPFVPMLFQGEEWGARTPFQYFTDHDDPVLARAVSEGRQREFVAFGWKPEDVPDPQREATFLDSKLDWAERERQPHADLRRWHQRLIAYRRTKPELGNGQLAGVSTDWNDTEGWFSVTRGRVTLAFNLSTQLRSVALSGSNLRLTLSSSEAVCLDGVALKLPPDSVAIVENEMQAG